MDFVEQIKQWCRQGEEDLRRENKLVMFAQVFGHDIIERHASENGRWYVRPQPQR